MPSVPLVLAFGSLVYPAMMEVSKVGSDLDGTQCSFDEGYPLGYPKGLIPAQIGL